MADITVKFGSVAVTTSDTLKLPNEAGNLSTEAITRIPKAPRSVGHLCVAAADAIEKAGKTFTSPAGVTPDSLRQAAQRADGIDLIIHDLEVLLHRYKQANLLFDAEAFEQARKVNDQVKAQAKHDPEIAKAFSLVTQGFANVRGTHKTPKEETTQT